MVMIAVNHPEMVAVTAMGRGTQERALYRAYLMSISLSFPLDPILFVGGATVTS